MPRPAGPIAAPPLPAAAPLPQLQMGELPYPQAAFDEAAAAAGLKPAHNYAPPAPAHSYGGGGHSYGGSAAAPQLMRTSMQLGGGQPGYAPGGYHSHHHM